MMGVSAQNNRINLAIAAWEWPSYFDPEERLKGIRLDMADYRRPSPETAPCHAKAAGLYMICTLSKHAAESKGYADALMLTGAAAWPRRPEPMFFLWITVFCTRRSPTAFWMVSRDAR